MNENRRNGIHVAIFADESIHQRAARVLARQSIMFYSHVNEEPAGRANYFVPDAILTDTKHLDTALRIKSEMIKSHSGLIIPLIHLCERAQSAPNLGVTLDVEVIDQSSPKPLKTVSNEFAQLGATIYQLIGIIDRPESTFKDSAE